jgi:uncharacterized protein
MSYNRDRLVARVMSDSTALNLISHGPKHWLNVATNGIKLAKAEGENPLFCELFGLLHDCQRRGDGGDPGHGRRAAAYARQIRTMLPLGAGDFKRLSYALTWHDDKTHTRDLGIGCCWDADRLDLPRVGVVTDPNFLNTETAKLIAIRRMR